MSVGQRGMICLQCEEAGPCLVITPPAELPEGARLVFQFTCGECGRTWQWSMKGGVYRFEREVTE